MGCERKSIFETSLNAYGLSSVVNFLVTLQGPSSWNKPMSESLPGPPFNHNVIGSFAGSFLDSKNQKKACMEGDRSMKPE